MNYLVKLFLFLFFMENLYGVSILNVVCNKSSEFIYLNGEFKAECDEGEKVRLSVNKGVYNLEIQKDNGDGSFYVFRKILNIGDGVIKQVVSKNEELLWRRKNILSAISDKNSIVVVGYIEDSFHKKKNQTKRLVGYIAKYDLKGNKIWENILNNNDSYEVINSIIKLSNGNFLIGGFETKSILARDEATQSVLYKINQSGRVIWKKKLFNNEVSEIDSIFKNGNDIFISGIKDGNLFIYKINDKGNPLCNKIINKDMFLVVWPLKFNIKMDKNYHNGVILVYSSYFGKKRGMDAYIVNFDKNCKILWDSNFGSNDYDYSDFVKNIGNNKFLGSLIVDLKKYFFVIFNNKGKLINTKSIKSYDKITSFNNYVVTLKNNRIKEYDNEGNFLKERYFNFNISHIVPFKEKLIVLSYNIKRDFFTFISSPIKIFILDENLNY